MKHVRLSKEDFLAEVATRYNRLEVSREELLKMRDDGISIPGFAWAVTTSIGRYDVREGSNIPTSKLNRKKPVMGSTVGEERDVAEILPVNHKFLKSLEVEKGTAKNAPSKMPGFIKWGSYFDIRDIIKSRRFFPCYITGLSGNGKTINVEQACAETGRGFHRVNITIETSEDDLIGGFRLKNGETVFEYGPVINAMIHGDVLLLDEIDLGGAKMMLLQSVLEGKGYYIKKLSKWIKPKEGFTVFATGNTKGAGSESGMFMYTQVMNEAMLERFKITIEQPYPDQPTERKILKSLFKVLTGMKAENEDLRVIDMLSEWATVIRESFNNDAIDSVISTRRNCTILDAYTVFGDISKSMEMTTARFDDETREAMMASYRTIDEKVSASYMSKNSVKSTKRKEDAKETEDSEFEAMMARASNTI